MSLELDFVYYRNFTFDGKFHMRCIGDDLPKVKSIHYLLERKTPDGDIVHLDGVTVPSQTTSAKVANYGCPATLSCDVRAGHYLITPKVRLVDSAALELDPALLDNGILRLASFVVQVAESELTRRILDRVPLPAQAERRKRQVSDPMPVRFPYQPEGQRYPPLILVFQQGGFARLMADLQPDSASLLQRHWPGLARMIDVQPFLNAQERNDERFAVLANHYWLEQPASMSNATFVALIQSLEALDYVEQTAFVPPQVVPGNLFALGASAVFATLLTGAAFVAGNRAHSEAQPTPDFTALQRYLNAPDAQQKGLNIRKAWEAGVNGRGARVHFSDAGLYFNHEDLRANPKLKLIPPADNSDQKHGTASVGILVARDNGFGMTGICHGAELFVYDNRAKDAEGLSQTLKKMLAYVNPGDIVAVNRQTANINALGTFLPSLHDQAWWDVTRALTERGAVVLNAACNGTWQGDPRIATTKGYGVDLARFSYFEDFGDADAILVGASHSWDGKPHHYSNYNYRYRMLNAWGDSVATTGYGDLQDRNEHDRDYTDSYSGTSSATPLVTGALALIQAYAIEEHHLYLNADQMHLLVMESGYKDATLPLTDTLPMGARPNVLGAMALLDRIVQAGRFYLPDEGYCSTDDCTAQG